MRFLVMLLTVWICHLPAQAVEESCEQIVSPITFQDVENVKQFIKQKLPSEVFVSFETTSCDAKTGHLIDPYTPGRNYYVNLLVSKYRKFTALNKQLCLSVATHSPEAGALLEALLGRRFPFKENGVWVVWEPI